MWRRCAQYFVIASSGKLHNAKCVYGSCFLNLCCSGCMGVYGNGCCVSRVVEDSGFSFVVVK